MGRRCTICHHPARKAIEAAMHAGASLAEAATLHPGLTKPALGRHMAKHAAPRAPVVCEGLPDPLAFLSSPLPPVRVRERLGSPVQPVSLNPPAPAGNVVQFRTAPPAPAELEIEPREEATPPAVAILLHHGYGLPEIMKRFGLGEGKMSTLLAELEDAYMGQAIGSCSGVVAGRNLWKCEYAIAELENDYQAAKRQGRNRDARECRRLILEERRELRSMHREYGITRPVHPDELHSDSKARRDANDIMFAVRNSIDGVFREQEPEPVRKPRLIG